MAKLFKDKQIKQKLDGYQIPNFEQKVELIKNWKRVYDSKELYKKSESQCEQAFNDDFFVKVLDYVKFPSEKYFIEPKGNTEVSGQKPDAILGYFSGEKRRVIAVVEIKDVNTSLDKSQKREGNLSPVQQAFKYKPQYKECDFVIVTNFFEIRLLKDNQLDFESFTLESLVDPRDNYFEFRKFYYLLNAANFIAKSGETTTLKLLSDIRVQQEQITKDFYQKYKNLRKELIKNILQNNKQARIRESFYTLAVEKAQKIIDRLVFICFCEDLGLLPDNKLQEVVFHTERLGLTIPIWDIMKSFFTAIDKGSEKLGIPDGYNGELFKEDEALNSLKIDDEICKKFVEFGNYDFTEDLSVNILGHIFEQSISDLEELKNISNKEPEGVEESTKVSKRKKDGIFYTPEYIVDYIVKNSLGKYLEDKEQAVLAKHGVKTDLTDENYHKRMKTAYNEYQEILRSVKVLDPACGSGAFLVKVFDYLLAENKRVSSILTDISEGKAELFNSESYIKSLLQNNIYGVDLNPESVEITKLSLWLKTARKGEKLVSLKNNIKCGNSLVDDPAIAGAQAFKWEEEFSEIMKSGRFDVIVGNPPYVVLSSFKNNEFEYLQDKYKTSYGRLNTFALFIEKISRLMSKNSKSSLILPDSLCLIDYYAKLREYILNNFNIEEIIELGDGIFEDATVPAIIFSFSSPLEKGNEILIGDKEVFLNPQNKKQQLPQSTYFKTPKHSFNLHIDEIFIKLNNLILIKKAKLLKDVIQIKIGVCTGNNKKHISNQPIFENSKKVLQGKDINRYVLKYANQYLNYDRKALLRARDEEIFLKNEKLFMRQTSDRLILSYDNKKYYSIDSLFLLYPKVNDVDLKYILCLLNSSLLTYQYQKLNPESGRVFAQVKIDYVNELPIILIDNKDQASFIEKADLMLCLNKEFQEKLQKTLTLLQHEFHLEKINTKLEKFYQLDFDSFIKALGLKKLDLQKKSEILDFFEKNKQDILSLKAEIDKEDALIDQMVYQLYGLTDEEIKIVESSMNP